MKGMVKFYNKEKGFGFVVSENNQNYYFNHEVIPFGHMPNSGDMVEFEVSDQPTSNKHKEPTIAKMTLTGEQATGTNAQNPNDNRVECPHCHKKGYPRIVTYRGYAARSLCPFCGEVVSDFTNTYLMYALAGVAATVYFIGEILFNLDKDTSELIGFLAIRVLLIIVAIGLTITMWKKHKRNGNATTAPKRKKGFFDDFERFFGGRPF